MAFTTPNWHEAVLIDVAAAILGLVLCAIVPIYRDREVHSILEEARAKGIFIPTVWRGFSYVDMMGRVRSTLPFLTDVWTVRGDKTGEDLAGLVEQGSAALELARPSPDAVKLIMYTSGTTGRAKGVLPGLVYPSRQSGRPEERSQRKKFAWHRWATRQFEERHRSR